MSAAIKPQTMINNPDTLLKIPNLKTLYIDNMNHADNIEAIGKLHYTE